MERLVARKLAGSWTDTEKWIGSVAGMEGLVTGMLTGWMKRFRNERIAGAEGLVTVRLTVI